MDSESTALSKYRDSYKRHNPLVSDSEVELSFYKAKSKNLARALKSQTKQHQTTENKAYGWKIAAATTAGIGLVSTAAVWYYGLNQATTSPPQHPPLPEIGNSTVLESYSPFNNSLSALENIGAITSTAVTSAIGFAGRQLMQAAQSALTSYNPLAQIDYNKFWTSATPLWNPYDKIFALLNSTTPLNYTDIQIFESLIQNCMININQADTTYNESLVMLAAQNGLLEPLSLLIEAGADLNWRNYKQSTALILASEAGYFQIVKLLIEGQALIDLTNIEQGSALMLAAQNGHTKIVKLLLEKNAQLDLRHQTGTTALMLACFRGYAAIAKLLIKAGANVFFKENKNGYDALTLASTQGHLEIIEFFKERQHTIQFSPEHWGVALIAACITNRAAAVGVILENNYPNLINWRTLEGFTPYTIALAKGYTDLLNTLKRAGALP